MASVNVGCPVFKVDWSDDNTIVFIGCSDGKVKALNVKSSQVSDIANHPGLTTMQVVNFKNNMIVVTMGSDSNIVFWKPGQNNPLMSTKMNKVPFVSDFSSPYLAIGCSESTVAVIDFNTYTNNQKIWYSKCNLDSPIMSIAVRPNSSRIAVGSVDGRICVTELDFGYNKNSFKLKDFILFRAHRNEVKKQP